MIVFIPMATGVELRDDVRASIMSQTLENISIIECKTPGLAHSQRVISPERYSAEVNSREACRDAIMFTKSDIVVMQDPDIYHKNHHNFQNMLGFLSDNRDIDAVCLWKKFGCSCGFSPLMQHIDIGCMMLRRRVLKDIHFRYDGSCICNSFKKDLESHGMAMCYYNDTRVVEEVL